MTVVGEAGTAEEAFEKTRRLRPDVVILDLLLPDGDGVEMIAPLRAEVPRLSVLVLTARGDADALVRSVTAGATGYLTKGATPAEMRDAVITLYGGGAVLDASLATDLLRGYERSPSGDALTAHPLLTAREAEVLGQVADGRTDKEIATSLSLSPRTVQSHLSAIRGKTGVHRRAELASWAIRHSLDYVASHRSEPGEAASLAGS